ncbi:MAG: Uma2 family endonuclease [Thermoanaerobaculia bacterium]
MATEPQTCLSATDYLAFEREAEERHEFVNGQIYARSGASPDHGLIATNLARELSLALKNKPCRVHATNLRVKVDETGLYTYPDLVVVCGDSQFDDAKRDTLLNPLMLVEVLSPSTEAYDRGAKFEHYRRLPSLSCYLLVAQDKPHLELFRRLEEGLWQLSEASGLEAGLAIPELGVKLALSEVYDKVSGLGPGLPEAVS